MLSIQWHEAVLHYLLALDEAYEARERGDRAGLRLAKWRMYKASEYLRMRT